MLTNQHNFIFRIVASMCFFCAASIFASEPTTTVASIPSSGDALKAGDELKLEVDAPIFHNPDGDAKIYCGPTGSRFRVDQLSSSQTSSLTASNSAGNTVEATSQTEGSKTTTQIKGAAIVTQTTTEPTISVHFPSPNSSSPFLPVYWWRKMFPDVTDADPNGECKKQSGSTPAATYGIVVSGGEYQVKTSDLNKYSVQRSGFTWGGMVIPYKFEFSDHSFQASPTLAAYVGYEGWWPGVSIANVLVLGGGAVSSSQTSTTTSSGGASSTQSTSTNVTYSAGFGEVATLGGTFKAGVILGWDWQGHNSGFKYEGKPWLAVSVGAGF